MVKFCSLFESYTQYTVLTIACSSIRVPLPVVVKSRNILTRINADLLPSRPSLSNCSNVLQKSILEKLCSFDSSI